MVYFELDQDGFMAPVSCSRKNFANSVDLSEIDFDLSKLTKYDLDCPGPIFRKVVQSNEEILTQNRALLKLFLRTKKLQGCTNDTLSTYNGFLVHFIYSVVKPVGEIRCNDIKNYIMDYAEERNVKYNTLDSIRTALNTFFNWCEEEDYVLKNPMRKIHKIKGEQVIQYPFTEEQVELIRDACISMRELALIDFLNTSGVRANELCNLNISDVDIDNKTGIVYGKGNKERVIYFSDSAKVHLRKYLNHRSDNNPALFVNFKKPYQRLSKRGLEYIVNCIGDRAGVPDCYPHRFRRTLATRLLQRGMPVEQVQKILGHTKIETTLIYAMVSDMDIKINHTKYA